MHGGEAVLHGGESFVTAIRDPVGQASIVYNTGDAVLNRTATPRNPHCADSTEGGRAVRKTFCGTKRLPVTSLIIAVGTESTVVDAFSPCPAFHPVHRTRWVPLLGIEGIALGTGRTVGNFALDTGRTVGQFGLQAGRTVGNLGLEAGRTVAEAPWSGAE